MRILSRTAVLAYAAFLSPSLAFSHGTTRRSLSFGPHLEAGFSADSVFILNSRDPHRVAQAFLHKLGYPDGSYFIRKDSYTDENTGISHIYARQVVNGLEVADGNINLNIRNGQVLGYGNSFFEGSVDSDVPMVPNWHQAVYCSAKTTHSSDPACGDTLHHLQSLALQHDLDTLGHPRDPRAAAFFFLQLAHPTPTSLDLSLSALKAERHECTSLEEGVSCQDWLLTTHFAGLEPIHARQVYVQTPGDGGSTYLNLAWRLETSLPQNDYVGYVSVYDPSKVISMADMVVDALAPYSRAWTNSLQSRVFRRDQQIILSHEPTPVNPNSAGTFSDFPEAGKYRVWKWGINDPESGERTLEKAPADRKASPLGWHSVPARNDPFTANFTLDKNVLVNYTTTVGNNVVVQEYWNDTKEWKNHHRPNGGPYLEFNFPYNRTAEPKDNINASITQLFYTANMYHDLLYQYGFDEASGNFQQFNFGKEGKENDAIILTAQDGRDRNNGYFIHTVDGKNSFCLMYLFDHSQPFRDGGLDAGILIHELSHGLSGRLTGGPGNKECLRTHDAMGMGEGWSDFIATTVRSTSTYQHYPIGAWAFNDEAGARGVPYSTDTEVNNWFYDRIRLFDDKRQHDIGAVWAEILYVVSNKLIDKHGFSDSLFPSTGSDFYRLIARDDGVLVKVPKHGNTLMLQLIVNGMKLQQCNPSFLQARNAIIKADEHLTGGENKCTLWEGFAERGMGTEALDYKPNGGQDLNDRTVPPDCKSG